MDVTERKAPGTDRAVATPVPAGRRLTRGAQLAVIAIGAGLLALYLVLSGAFAPSPPPPAPVVASADSFKPTDQQWAGFKTATVQPVAFADTENTDGKIAIDDDLTTPVFSPYSGRVTRLFARAGGQVRAGDALLAVQASEFVQGANDLLSALATDRSTRAQLAFATTTERRQHELYLAQGSALKDWQQSQSDLASAQGNFNSAEVALGAVRNRLRILGKTALEVRAMEAATDPTRFSPEAIVTAPIGGTIIQRQVGLGQNIVTQQSGGAPPSPLFTIGDTSRLWLVANAREVDAPQIHVGDDVVVHVLALPGREFKARLTYVSSSIDPSTHRLAIHAEIANPDGLLKPEMFATFRIVTGAAVSAPSIPEAAIVYDPDGAHVWLAGPDKTLLIRHVSLGRHQDGQVEVLEGLRPGDVVVTAGAVFIDRAAEAD